MSAPKLTPEQIEDAMVLREQRGWSYARIGRRFDVSAQCISWHCLRFGADAPKHRARLLPQTARGPAEFTRRDGVVVRRFTPDEDAQLTALAARDLNPSQIGRRMKRSPQAVTARLLTLARQAERAEVVATLAAAAPQAGAHPHG